MTVNAFSQDSLTLALQQGAQPLVVRNPDGTVLMHGAVAARYFSTEDIALPALPIPQPINGVSDTRFASVKPTSSPSHYELQVRENLKLGRIWSSKVRRLTRQQGCDRYQAMQEIARQSSQPVTDIRRLIELHNKALRRKATTMRQNLVWQKHLAGMTDIEIGAQLRIHPKTVASDRKQRRAKELT